MGSEHSTSGPAGEQKSLARRLGPAGVLGVLWAAFPAIAGTLLLVNMQTVSEWFTSKGPWGPVLYTAMFIVTAGCGLLPTYAQAALAGWCFGFALGFPAAMIGFVGAALVGYAIARTVSRHRVEDVIRDNPKARAVREALIGRGSARTLGIVTLLRLPPNSPFALTNLVMASTAVPLVAFGVGTLVGMAPRTAAAVIIGGGVKMLTKENLESATPRWVIIGGVAVTVAVVLIIGRIATNAIRTAANGSAPAEPAIGSGQA